MYFKEEFFLNPWIQVFRFKKFIFLFLDKIPILSLNLTKKMTELTKNTTNATNDIIQEREKPLIKLWTKIKLVM